MVVTLLVLLNGGFILSRTSVRWWWRWVRTAYTACSARFMCLVHLSACAQVLHPRYEIDHTPKLIITPAGRVKISSPRRK